MIAPNKHTAIRTSILYIAGIALKEIKSNGIIKYDDLRHSVTNAIGTALSDSFEYALSFLFLLDNIIYNKTSDTFTTKL